jgi:hypothetical protein
MSVTATENATTQLTTDTIETRPEPQFTLVIDRFDHWHNQDFVMLRPTSITWETDRPTTVGRVA